MTDAVKQLENAEQDYLVEIRGQISRSPLNESLETVFRMLNMFGVDLHGNAKPQQGQGGGGKQKRGQQQQQRATSLADQFQIDAEGRMGLLLMQRIREGLAQSKVLDAVMRPSGIEDLSVVMALALEFLPEGALDNMLSGDFSVLSQVTRLIKGSDEISLYQRTVFKNLDSESLDEMFDGLRKSPLFKLSDNPSSVQAPALQIMPLAIYTQVRTRLGQKTRFREQRRTRMPEVVESDRRVPRLLEEWIEGAVDDIPSVERNTLARDENEL